MAKRAGKPIKRMPGETPCKVCPKIPDGAVPCPENAVELTPRNEQCWRHYRECRAVNWQVPDAADPLVRQHAAAIREVEDMLARAESQAFSLMAAVATKGK